MVKEKKPENPKKNILRSLIFIFIGIFLIVFLLSAAAIYGFEKIYSQKIIPDIRVDGISFGGKKPEEVEKYFAEKKVHPMDLKATLAVLLDKLIEPVCRHFEEDATAKELLNKVRSYQVTR